MFKRSFSLLFVAALSAAGTCAATPPPDAADVLDGQFTATLEQHAHRWRLQPLRGDEVDVTDRSTACGSRTPIPHGLWYVTRDGDGNAVLIAPSATALPRDFPAHVALRACGEAADANATLFVPAVALAWIHSNVGTVMIDD
ncbi:MAG TPA: hypothetical protein VF132_01640 [Rudaea sp.]